jgi:hypothetical protein
MGAIAHRLMRHIAGLNSEGAGERLLRCTALLLLMTALEQW